MSTTPPSVLSRAVRALATAGTALLVGALVATAGALPATAAPVAAATATTTDFTVRLTTPAGTPLTTVTATAIEVADGDVVPGSKKIVATAVKGSPGSFIFSKLRAVPYTLSFAPSGSAAKAAFYQLLGGETEYSRATTFVPSATNSSLDVSLESNAPLTGTVTNSKKAGVKKVTVTAYLFARGEWLAYASAVTDSKGRYAIYDVDPGAYKLEFRTPYGSTYATEYSGDAYSLDAAAVIDARLGITMATSTTLGTGGTIKGVARIKSYGKYYALGSVYGVAYPMVPDAYGYNMVRDYANAITGKASSKKGAWSITGLVPGTYQVTLFPNYYDVPSRDLMRGSYDLREFTVKGGSTAKAPTTTFSVQEPAYAAIVVKNGDSYYSKPLKNAKVTLTQFGYDGYVYKGTTNSKGKVNVGHVSRGHGKYRNVMARGNYDLTVSAPGYGTHHSVIGVWDSYGNAEVIGLVPFSKAAFPTPPTIYEPAKPAVVGRTFTVYSSVDESWDRYAQNRRYQWLRDGSPIYGAVDMSYTAGSADLGHHLSVRVSVRPEGGTVSSAYAWVGGVDGVIGLAAAPVATIRPVISPATSAHVGDVLATTPGTWAVTALRYSYEWLVGDEVRGTERTYTVTDADAGLDIRSRVTVSKPGYPDATSSSTAVTIEPLTAPVPPVEQPRDAAAPADDAATDAPATGMQLVEEPTLETTDSTFTLSSLGTTSPSGTATVVWKRDGYQVGTGPSYVRKSQDAGALITAVVTYTVADYAPLSHTVVAQKGAARYLDGLYFEAAYGKAITAPDPQFYFAAEARASLSISYQWSRANGEIPGATASTFTPAASDIGSVFTLRMSIRSPYYADSLYQRDVRVMPGTITVGDVLLDFDGYVSPGTVLRVSAPTTPASTERTYQWTRNGTGREVIVSTEPTYQLTTADLGFGIQVRVTFSATDYTTTTRWSSSATVREPGDIAARGPVRISGGSAVGETLSADASALAGPDVSLSYQWLRDGAVLPAATGATYTLERRDFGTAVSVRVTAKRPEYTLGYTVSNVVLVSAGTAPTAKTAPVISGTAAACAKLTASAGTWSRGNLTFHYQWLADGIAIDGATHSSYTIPATSVGSSISVSVTAVGSGYEDGSATSVITAAVVAKAGC